MHTFDCTGTLFFGRWAVKLTGISVLALGTCTPFDSTGTLFFGRWTIKVTGSSDLALRTLACYWYINLGKITSMQFSKSVDFLDASQVYLDGVAVKTNQVKSSKLFDPRKSHICHTICKDLAGQVYNCTVQG